MPKLQFQTNLGTYTVKNVAGGSTAETVVDVHNNDGWGSAAPATASSGAADNPAIAHQDMAGFEINNLLQGGLASDATTKAYVDAAIPSLAGLHTNPASAALDQAGFTINNLGSGAAASDAVNKGQLDAVAAGLHWKNAVRAASTGANINVGVGTLLTVDTVVLLAGDRVLLYNQTAPAENGVYVAAVGAWTRATDLDGNPQSELENGVALRVLEGATNAQIGFTISGAADPITVGVDAIPWVSFGGGGTLHPGEVITPDGVDFAGANADAASTGTVLQNYHFQTGMASTVSQPLTGTFPLVLPTFTFERIGNLVYVTTNISMTGTKTNTLETVVGFSVTGGIPTWARPTTTDMSVCGPSWYYGSSGYPGIMYINIAGTLLQFGHENALFAGNLSIPKSTFVYSVV